MQLQFIQSLTTHFTGIFADFHFISVFKLKMPYINKDCECHQTNVKVPLFQFQKQNEVNTCNFKD